MKWRHFVAGLALWIASVPASAAAIVPFSEDITLFGPPTAYLRTFTTDRNGFLKIRVTDRNAFSAIFAPWDFVFLLTTNDVGPPVVTSGGTPAQFILQQGMLTRFFSFIGIPGVTYTLELFADAGASAILQGNPELSSLTLQVDEIPAPPSVAMALPAVLLIRALRRRKEKLSTGAA